MRKWARENDLVVNASTAGQVIGIGFLQNIRCQKQAPLA